jgi:type I restriction enzyme R subunit
LHYKRRSSTTFDEVAFFQAVKARLVKFEATIGGQIRFEIETAIKQIVDEALSSDKVIDIFEAAGIDKPEISFQFFRRISCWK